jgi:Holliday junction resolvase
VATNGATVTTEEERTEKEMRGGASPRRRGDSFERRVRSELEEDGWLVVRSAGSLGSFDLMAMRAGDEPLLIQVKIDAKINLKDRERLLGDALKSGATAWVVSRGPAPRYRVLWEPMADVRGARRVGG